jgi:hypothetical protein
MNLQSDNQYHQKVDSSIQNLNTVYNKVLRLSEGLEDNLVGKNWISDDQIEMKTTFSEQMNIIKIYSKLLGVGKQPSNILTKEESEVFTSHNMMDGLVWYYITDYIESLTQWLDEILIKCEEILRIKYEPGGQYFLQTQIKFLEKYEMKL